MGLDEPHRAALGPQQHGMGLVNVAAHLYVLKQRIRAEAGGGEDDVFTVGQITAHELDVEQFQTVSGTPNRNTTSCTNVSSMP